MYLKLWVHNLRDLAPLLITYATVTHLNSHKMWHILNHESKLSYSYLFWLDRLIFIEELKCPNNKLFFYIFCIDIHEHAFHRHSKCIHNNEIQQYNCVLDQMFLFIRISWEHFLLHMKLVALRTHYHVTHELNVCLCAGWSAPQTRWWSRWTPTPSPSGSVTFPPTWSATWLKSPPCWLAWATTPTPTLPTTPERSPWCLCSTPHRWGWKTDLRKNRIAGHFVLKLWINRKITRFFFLEWQLNEKLFNLTCDEGSSWIQSILSWLT